MEYKDYYKIMGVSRDATPDDIKRAHRQLARKYHPDVNKSPDAEAKFKELGEAYEVLKDAEKRAAYDQLGSNYKSGQDFHPPPDWNTGFEFSGGGFTGGDASDYSDFFEQLFGRTGGRKTGASFHSAGEDHHAKISIDLEDSFSGASRIITLQAMETDAQGNPVKKEHKLNVKIPKGISAGQNIRLTGQGSPGHGQAKPGDLYLEIEFRQHQLYRVDGLDVFLELPVAPWEAIIGATVKVPTPGGIVELKIPPGSVSGSKLRLKGRGIPRNTAPGDFYAIIQISLPPAESEANTEFYRKMAEQFKSFNPRAKLGV